MTIKTRRLAYGDHVEAKRLFELMAEVFSEEFAPLSGQYLDHLLSRRDFWVVAAFADGEVIGGITAHVLPMTRSESSELFIYDIAVRADHQRQGVGRILVMTLRQEAFTLGIKDVFVAADDADMHALDFYRTLGARSSPVTIFTFAVDLK